MDLDFINLLVFFINLNRLPIFITNSLNYHTVPKMNILGYAGVTLFTTGFCIETIAGTDPNQ